MDSKYRVMVKEAQLICHTCLKVFKGHIFYSTQIFPDTKGAIWEVLSPTKRHPATCPDCQEIREQMDEAINNRASSAAVPKLQIVTAKLALDAAKVKLAIAQGKYDRAKDACSRVEETRMHVAGRLAQAKAEFDKEFKIWDKMVVEADRMKLRKKIKKIMNLNNNSYEDMAEDG